MPLNYIDRDIIETATLIPDNFTPAGFTITTSTNTTSALSGTMTNTFSTQNNLSATEFQVIQNLQLAANQSIRNFDSTFGIILSQSSRQVQMVFNQFNFSLDSGVLQASNLVGGAGYGYNGADQKFTVPAGVRYVFAKLWGAGGGQGRQGSWTYSSNGGGGGHTRGVIPVTPGERLTLVLGRGGLTSCFSAEYGGGGWPGQNSDIQYSGLGGGYAGIFRGEDAGVAANALLIAGGGGGGGSVESGWSETSDGGGGGGFVGARGECTINDRFDFAGTGGTQTAGGRAPLFGGITVGSQFLGGRVEYNSYGGGGGAGWWGGGGGYHISGAGAMAGGGGGSGYIHSSVIFGSTYTAFGYTPAFFWDTDLPTAGHADATRYAHGGLSLRNNIGNCNQSGGNAYLAIWW